MDAFSKVICRKLEIRSGYMNIQHLSRNGVQGSDIYESLERIDMFCNELGYTALHRDFKLKDKRRYLLVLDGATWKYFFIRQRKIR